ncbi:hypothetical protein KIPB_002835 [Kipferlia bialata]|uniref:Uncharacterized protein n=1 Tax=Kipferlia bialata TaxID=797122 RepID=A0A9K3CRB2_9EUKA|nr:hypothetical protein KIPB_002835 [Kipferlia bialata]|eukprot:g2835.t1
MYPTLSLDDFLNNHDYFLSLEPLTLAPELDTPMKSRRFRPTFMGNDSVINYDAGVYHITPRDDATGTEATLVCRRKGIDLSYDKWATATVLRMDDKVLFCRQKILRGGRAPLTVKYCQCDDVGVYGTLPKTEGDWDPRRHSNFFVLGGHLIFLGQDGHTMEFDPAAEGEGEGESGRWRCRAGRVVHEDEDDHEDLEADQFLRVFHMTNGDRLLRLSGTIRNRKEGWISQQFSLQEGWKEVPASGQLPSSCEELVRALAVSPTQSLVWGLLTKKARKSSRDGAYYGIWVYDWVTGEWTLCCHTSMWLGWAAQLDGGRFMVRLSDSSIERLKWQSPWFILSLDTHSVTDDTGIIGPADFIRD